MVLISSEVEEIIGMSDRVLILNKGRAMGIFGKRRYFADTDYQLLRGCGERVNEEEIDMEEAQAKRGKVTKAGFLNFINRNNTIIIFILMLIISSIVSSSFFHLGT